MRATTVPHAPLGTWEYVAAQLLARVLREHPPTTTVPTLDAPQTMERADEPRRPRHFPLSSRAEDDRRRDRAQGRVVRHSRASSGGVGGGSRACGSGAEARDAADAAGSVGRYPRARATHSSRAGSVGPGPLLHDSKCLPPPAEGGRRAALPSRPANRPARRFVLSTLSSLRAACPAAPRGFDIQELWSTLHGVLADALSAVAPLILPGDTIELRIRVRSADLAVVLSTRPSSACPPRTRSLRRPTPQIDRKHATGLVDHRTGLQEVR